MRNLSQATSRTLNKLNFFSKPSAIKSCHTRNNNASKRHHQPCTNSDPKRIRLGDVEKVRPDITQDLNLALRLANKEVIATPRLAQLVLALKHNVHEDSSTEEEQEHVCEHDAVASAVMRLLLGAVDVGRHDSVHVSPADDDADHDAALQRALDVVGRPGQGVGDGGVDAHCAEEGSGVLDVHVAGGEEHHEADAADEGDDHVAVSAPLGLVGNVADHNGHDGSDGVRGHGEQLELGSGVLHALENGRQEQREAVQRAQAAHVDDGVAPRLPVDERGLHVARIDLSDAGACLAVGAEAAHGAELLVGVEEGGGVREVEDHPPAEDADEDGHQSFDDKDPAPPLVAGDAVHLRDGGGEETTEGSGESGSGEEESRAETEFLALVPAAGNTLAQRDGYARKERAYER